MLASSWLLPSLLGTSRACSLLHGEEPDRPEDSLHSSASYLANLVGSEYDLKASVPLGSGSDHRTL